MRLVIDMQGAQTASRDRGIGRYTKALVLEMSRMRGENEIILALNGAYPDTISSIRSDFAKLLPEDAIRVYEVFGPVGGHDTANDARRKAAEAICESFFASLQPDVILITSLFEGFGGDSVTSIHSLHNIVPVGVILYDLIPLIHKERYLKDPAMLRWYFSKIEHLRRANLILSISDSSRQEGIQYLNLPENIVLNISAACDEYFQPIKLDKMQRKSLMNFYGIDRPFVLATGDTDARKNLDGLFSAYASLPSKIRQTYALVLFGHGLSVHKEYFIELAKKAGVEEHELIFTGFVPDEDLVLLYNACELFVFPSWHEGFGLPVLEAMACGKAVIAAGSSSLPEVVGRHDVLFESQNTKSMSTKIVEVLGNPDFREELERHGLMQAKKFSWVRSAHLVWDALENLHVEYPVQNSVSKILSARRPKLAFVSPLPSGSHCIANYAFEILPYLSKSYDITLIVEHGSDCDIWIDTNMPIRDVSWFRQHAYEFERILYHMADSVDHIHIFTLIKEIPGVVDLHDFFLSDTMAIHMEERSETVRGWTKVLLQSHGWTAVRDRFKQDNIEQTIRQWPCNLAVLQQALGIIVHSVLSCQSARKFYGKKAANDWAVIHYSRQTINQVNKSVAREKMRLSPNEFVICSFGIHGASEHNQKLVNAWITSLSSDVKNRLVFVGENKESEYENILEETFADSPFKERIGIIVGLSNEAYQDWLSAADLAVVLHTSEWDLTLRTVIECMSFGLPTIVNGSDTLLDFSSDAVWMLPDDYSQSELIQALTTFSKNQLYRAELGMRAQSVIRAKHNPRVCAEKYADAIESAYEQASLTLHGLTQVLPQLIPQLPTSEYPLLTKVLAVNFPPKPRLRQILLDVSELVQIDAKTGIQRVTRSLLERIISSPPVGWVVEPVYAMNHKLGYCYARKFISRYMKLPSDWAEDAPVQIWAGDIFFGLDYQPQIIPAQKSILSAWHNQGVKIYFLVHDLLPILMPRVFPKGSRDGHQRWLETISLYDGVICVSKAVADEMYNWLKNYKQGNEKFSVYWSHSGADIDRTESTKGLPNDATRLLDKIKSQLSFLMVGTIEPRKAILQTIQAFDQLWSQGYDINLVIVGKEGWKTLSDADRRDIPQTVEELLYHPEHGKRLFWLEAISDEYLEQVYAASNCLIAASYGEGFGLPIIEAACHRLPIIARDIPVFREVAANDALFFADSPDLDAVSRVVQEWIKLYQQKKHPAGDAIPFLTWDESAEIALDILLGKKDPYYVWFSR